MVTINSVIVPGTTRCYRFSNADGKSWLLPASGLSTAMELYQPSGVKGKLLKRLFPLLHRVGRVRDAIHATVDYVDLHPALLKMICRSLGTDNIEFSIFGGTPSVHQKITLQLFQGTHILGYAKLTDSRAISKLFRHEEKLLTELAEAGIQNIPCCLNCSTLPDGTSVFIQSTVKTSQSIVYHRWTDLHENFLQNMAQKTFATLRFEESDLAKSLSELLQSLGRLPEEYQMVIGPALRHELESHRGQTVTYSAFHADFTPWNMFIESDRLFVFDWEYGRRSYPPMLDRYHFFTQQALHVSHLTAEQILSALSAYQWYKPNEFILYLLDIISRFTLREEEEISSSTLNMIGKWTELLKLIQGRHA